MLYYEMANKNQLIVKPHTKNIGWALPSVPTPMNSFSSLLKT